MTFRVLLLAGLAGSVLVACETGTVGDRRDDRVIDAEAGLSAEMAIPQPRSPSGPEVRPDPQTASGSDAYVPPAVKTPPAQPRIEPPSLSGVPVGSPLSPVTPVVPADCPRGELVEVLIRMDISRDGEPSNTGIVYSDEPCYNEAALAAVKAVRYQPLFNGERPEPMTGVMSGITFDTRYSATEVPR